MSDYWARRQAAERRLAAISAVTFALLAEPESLAPVWLTTPEGLAYLEALQRGDAAQALDIWDQAYGRALDAWTALLWQAPCPTKEVPV
jgi:hypothetical protein